MTPRLLLPLFVILTACPPGPGPQGECPKLDNGKPNCAYQACASEPACTVLDGGPIGSCDKCGKTCTSQDGCFKTDFIYDSPLPLCSVGLCRAAATPRDVIVTLETGGGFNGTVASANVRFISPVAVDGSTVTCATLAAVATSDEAGSADALERSGRFNLIGYELAGTPGYQPGNALDLLSEPNGDSAFLLWAEMWGGPRDSSGKYPTGKRQGKGCVDSGAHVAPVTATASCPDFKKGPDCRHLIVTVTK